MAFLTSPSHRTINKSYLYKANPDNSSQDSNIAVMR